MTIKKHFKNGDRTNLSNWIVLVLYLSMFILTVLCFKFDEVIATYPQSKNEIAVSIIKNTENYFCYALRTAPTEKSETSEVKNKVALVKG